LNSLLTHCVERLETVRNLCIRGWRFSVLIHRLVIVAFAASHGMPMPNEVVPAKTLGNQSP
jgi:hypothetical protein